MDSSSGLELRVHISNLLGQQRLLLLHLQAGRVRAEGLGVNGAGRNYRDGHGNKIQGQGLQC